MSPEKFAMGIPAHKLTKQCLNSCPERPVHQSRMRQGRGISQNINQILCQVMDMLRVQFLACNIVTEVRERFHFGTKIKVLIIPSLTLLDMCFYFFVLWPVVGNTIILLFRTTWCALLQYGHSVLFIMS